MVLDDILHYIPKYKNNIFVLFFSGSVLQEHNLNHLCRQIAILHSLGIKIVLVHGSRQQISEKTTPNQNEIHVINNESIRVTPVEILQIATEVSLQLSYKILKSLTNTHLTGFTMNPIIGNFVKARPMGIIHGIDFLHTGQVDKIRKSKLYGILRQGFLPIVPPLGLDSEGNHYNLRGVDIAAQIAVALNAKKLIYCFTDNYKWLSDQMGMMDLDDLQTKIHDLQKRSPLDELLSERLGSAMLACQKGVERIHFINGLSKDAILQEVFTKAGHGLLLTGKKYNNIRQASLSDLQRILEILQNSQNYGELKNRSSEDIALDIKDYYVFELDEKICAVAALHPCQENQAAELAGLAVDPHYRHLGIGKKMVSYMIESMEKKRIIKIFAFTTRAARFFRELHFEEVETKQAPECVQKKWQKDRNSQLFVYET